MFSICLDDVGNEKKEIGGEVGEDDWVIAWNGRSVGRISLDAFPYNDAKLWTWATWVHPAEPGRVDTMKEARETVKSVVCACLAARASAVPIRTTQGGWTTGKIQAPFHQPQLRRATLPKPHRAPVLSG